VEGAGTGGYLTENSPEVARLAATVPLHHGTTLHRARRILAGGPDPNFVEPSGQQIRAEHFSTAYADGRVLAMGKPEDYARLKATNFPNEGGPVILEMEVPDWVVDVVLNDPIGSALARSGEVRFEPGYGLDELLREWPTIPKRVLPL
jgi:hypothetical protein